MDYSQQDTENSSVDRESSRLRDVGPDPGSSLVEQGSQSLAPDCCPASAAIQLEDPGQ